MRIRYLALGLAFALMPLQSQAEIIIGVGAPITGSYASFGDQLKRGAEAAVADINAAGGVLGQKLTLVVGDDACDPKQAVSAANSFVNHKAVFVAGHYCSGSSIPASDVYSDAGIVQISPGSTNPLLTERHLPTVFRVCGRDDQQGAIAGAYVAAHFAGKRIAIVHDKTAYGKGLADETKKALNAAGTNEVLYEAITAGERDYSALVTRLKSMRVDVLYYGGYHTESGQIARQMRLAGLAAQLISGDATVTQEFWSIAGEAGAGTLMTFSPDPRNIPAASKIVEKFRKDGFEPEGYTLYTYAAVQIWAQAAATAKTTDADKVSAAIHKGTFQTVIGEMSFDEKGDPKGKQYIFYVWQNGTYKPL